MVVASENHSTFYINMWFAKGEFFGSRAILNKPHTSIPDTFDDGIHNTNYR